VCGPKTRAVTYSVLEVENDSMDSLAERRY
jgi:hypothetical protein